MVSDLSKKGAPPCGLYIRVKVPSDPAGMEKTIADIRAIMFVINGSDYERNMHVFELVADSLAGQDDEALKTLVSFIRQNGMVCLSRLEAKRAKDCGFDGVLCAVLDEIIAARDVFGDDGIVGAACGQNEDLLRASIASDVDFVSFGSADHVPAALNLLYLAGTLADVAILVEGPVTNDDAAYWVKAGATFLDAGAYVFGHEKGVMQGTVNMLHAIDLAFEDEKKSIQ